MWGRDALMFKVAMSKAKCPHTIKSDKLMAKIWRRVDGFSLVENNSKVISKETLNCMTLQYECNGGPEMGVVARRRYTVILGSTLTSLYYVVNK